jgi:hypothetical protein
LATQRRADLSGPRARFSKGQAMRFAFRHHWHRNYYDRGYGGYYSPWNDYQSRAWAANSYYGGDFGDCDDWY